MGMPRWRYIYPITATVDLPGKGPTVLRPQDEFEAPRATVKHLVKIKRVVGPLRERPKPPAPKEEVKEVAKKEVIPPPKRGPVPEPKKEPVSEPKKEESASVAESQNDEDDQTVVASESSSATTELTEEEAPETSRSDEEEKGKEKENMGRRYKRSRSRS